MISCRKTTPDDLLSLWTIEQREYPEYMRSPSFGAFKDAMAQRVSVTILDGVFIVGCVSFQETGPTEVIAHCFVLREKFGLWLNRKIIGTILSIPFKVMGKARISIPIVVGTMCGMEGWLVRIGFKREGVLRRALLRDGVLCDITMLGMIEEDLRFKGV